jgi:hypothetical protein
MSSRLSDGVKAVPYRNDVVADLGFDFDIHERDAVEYQFTVGA